MFETDFKEVINRRVSRGRDRDFIDSEFVKLEIDEERKEAIRISQEGGLPLEIIYNEKTIEEVLSDFGNTLVRYDLFKPSVVR